MYGCATWSLTSSEEQSLDGSYTRMLRMVLNVNWSAKTTNKTLYGNLRKVSDTIRERRLKLAGHVYRDKSSPAHQTITWQPSHGVSVRGRPRSTFVDTLLRDTNVETTEDLHKCMQDRDVWRLLSSSRCCNGFDRK